MRGLGPLLWHWENNNTNDLSVELDLEELKNLARTIGFELSVSFFFFYIHSESPFPERVNTLSSFIINPTICQNERTIDATYTNNAESMLGYIYHAAFWTATKVA